ncbi:MAG: ABC transporter permease [Deltaproteobacteria bacterium]|nr:ABC transporter permease [Deltaproteobacteria bacterium]
MRYPSELWIALRYLRPVRGRGFLTAISLLTVAGIALGVTSLVIVFSVATGFQETLRAKLLGVQGHALVQPMEGVLRDPAAIRRAVEAVPGVVSAAPFATGQVMVAAAGEVKAAAYRGVDLSGPRPLERFGPGAAGVALSALRGREPAVVLGRELARSLKLRTGSVIQLILPVGSVPTLRAHRVVGVISLGEYSLDSALVLASLESAQEFLRLGPGASGLEVRVRDADEAPAVASEIQRRLGAGYIAVDWTRLHRPMFAAFQIQKFVLLVILSLIVLVAAFNVASTLIMFVLGKTEAIGILRSMGASGRYVWRIFAACGLLMGGVGAVVGLALGVGACAILSRYPVIRLPSDIYLFESLPVAWRPGLLVLIGVAAVALAFAASLYPAWRASRLDPLQVLRAE